MTEPWFKTDAQLICEHNERVMSPGPNQTIVAADFTNVKVINPGRYAWHQIYSLNPCGYGLGKFIVNVNASLSSNRGGKPDIRMVDYDGHTVASFEYDDPSDFKSVWFSAEFNQDSCSGGTYDYMSIDISWATTSPMNVLISGGMILLISH